MLESALGINIGGTDPSNLDRNLRKDRDDHTSGSHVWWPGTPHDLSLEAIINGTAYVPLGRADFPRIESERLAGTRASYVATLVEDEAELREILELRREAYERHGRSLDIHWEKEDLDKTNAVLAVRDIDRELFATMRVTFCLAPDAEWSKKFQLPYPYHGSRLSSFERLAIRGGGLRAARAKQALFKVAFLLSLAMETDWVVISTISPLNRLFESLGFINIFGHEQQVRVDWYGDPVYVLALKSNDSGRTLLKANRVWYDHIVAPDPGSYATLASYFRSRRGGKATVPSVESIEGTIV
ncbi:MAG: hypothetical protein AB7G13_24730 [Lautropia sp.]